MSRLTAHASRLSVPHWALPLSLLVAACDTAQPLTGICTAPRSIAVEVDVTDSLSGRALADSASGSLRIGQFSSALVPVDGFPSLLLGGSKLGTYEVTITHPGYAPWTRSGVVVSQTGICGNVIPVHLDARLQPAP